MIDDRIQAKHALLWFIKALFSEGLTVGRCSIPIRELSRPTSLISGYYHQDIHTF